MPLFSPRSQYRNFRESFFIIVYKFAWYTKLFEPMNKIPQSATNLTRSVGITHFSYIYIYIYIAYCFSRTDAIAFMDVATLRASVEQNRVITSIHTPTKTRRYNNKKYKKIKKSNERYIPPLTPFRLCHCNGQAAVVICYTFLIQEYRRS